MKSKWIIGVDEAGRGPLAGPVAMGTALVPYGFDWEALLPGVGDSKQLSEKTREGVYMSAWRLRHAGVLDWSVGLTSAKSIDERGIQWAIRDAMYRALRALAARNAGEMTQGRKTTPINWSGFAASSDVRLDGSLYAPVVFKNQETIIKGDALEPSIGLASIVAKVTRDRYMRRLATQAAYQSYDFAVHKGYGTKAHRAAIATHGLSPEHRATFCKNIKVL